MTRRERWLDEHPKTRFQAPSPAARPCTSTPSGAGAHGLCPVDGQLDPEGHAILTICRLRDDLRTLVAACSEAPPAADLRQRLAVTLHDYQHWRRSPYGWTDIHGGDEALIAAATALLGVHGQ